MELELKLSKFLKGLKHGIPIFLGYLSVSFGFGILAVKNGLSVTEAAAISLFNLTSAGQAAGVGIIAAGGSITEMILAQIIINLRYSLMSLSLSQKLDKSFTLPRRLIVSYGITDEIFAMASVQPGRITPWYMYGIILISTLGWVLGTILGAAAGTILPAEVSDALGIMLYGMFIAIIIPPAKINKGILVGVLIAAAASAALYYLAPFISSGFAVIICAVIAAALCAVLFPKNDPANVEDGESA